MGKQTKSSIVRPEESREDMRWVNASIEESLRDLEERRELTELLRRQIEAIVGPYPRPGE
jgi:hypothetical protein